MPQFDCLRRSVPFNFWTGLFFFFFNLFIKLEDCNDRFKTQGLLLLFFKKKRGKTKGLNSSS